MDAGARSRRPPRASGAARRDLDALAAWITSRPSFGRALRDHTRVVRYATPPPEMADAPWRIPPLATTHELASWLGVDHAALVVLADRRGISQHARDPRARHYRYRWLAKPSGDHRLLEAPKPRLRAVQRAILDGILAAIPPTPRFGPSTQNRDAHPDFAAHLRGRVAWVAALDPAKGARLRAAFAQIRWA